MTYTYYYHRGTACWWGYWQDSNGNQLHEAITAHKKDDLLIELGRIKDDYSKKN